MRQSSEINFMQRKKKDESEEKKTPSKLNDQGDDNFPDSFEESFEDDEEMEEEEEIVPSESKISKTLSDRNTKIVIILILSCLFILPLFQLTTYHDKYTSFEASLVMLKDFYEAGDTANYENGFNFTWASLSV